jgi:hypothetical protein
MSLHTHFVIIVLPCEWRLFLCYACGCNNDCECECECECVAEIFRLNLFFVNEELVEEPLPDTPLQVHSLTLA